ncbi:PBP1A family penicillin-binding protein [Halobacillus naozhouensis]|uniref:PBP1A family penicillin-binding protein n=1 Tax=Halobacillus naozhouensis TaxID=554880 RepID=A0ABY8IUW6_9BACI|nr:PBP1A family penicillin-binding protein [Halobacillus naozhouensis]WFT73069.1 PBP1A family penicillin-binding protein [Halobacillus naozhouensis]
MANESQSRSARRKQLKSNKKGTKKPTFKRIVMTLLTLGIVLMLAVGGLFTYYILTAPELNEEQLSDPISSKLYDKNGDFITDLAGKQRRTKVSYNDLPPKLIDAVLATEDVRFFEHIGIDFRRIAAAIIANIKEGFGAEGASTITQQVVKRSFLSSDKTLKRKVQEQYLAIKLDQEYSKEKILEMYLNKIYYGRGAYGVAEAAQTYFGKNELSKLTLPEIALLAGLPQRPSAYNPYENPELAKQRMSVVLSLMVQHGKISEEEAEKARQTNVEDLLAEQTERESPYKAFIDQVREEVEAKMDGANIYKDGLKIYTTLDPEAQQYVEQMLGKESTINWPGDKVETGVAVTDTQTGAVRAIGGGRSYKEGNFNYATDTQRHPGSTLKPISAYGPAIQYNKLSTYHQIKDEPIDINGYSPNNYDDRFRGWVSMRYALSRSLNIPAVKTLHETGLNKAQKFAEGLGINFEDDQMYLSDAIGGGNAAVSPLQLSGAYAAFGNEGVYNEPYTVRKVEVPGQGTVDLKPEPKSAMNSYTAYMITSMLQTVMSEGTGTAANVPGLPEAGKTGTTNSELKNGNDIVPDSWFSGYTTNYSISIWTGYPDEYKNLSEATQDIPKQMFKSIMSHISEGKETSDFQKPGSVERVEVEEGSRPAKLPSPYTPESRIITELFHVDNTPSQVSQVFQKLDPVQDLSASYDTEAQAINLEWGYEEPEGVSFEVTVSIDGGESRQLTRTKDSTVEITNAQPGSSYEFTVTAVSDNENAEASDPASASVEVPAEEGAEENPEGETPEEENPEGETPEDEQNNEGNGNQNGNNGNNGNENGNESGNGQGNDGQGNGNQNENPDRDNTENEEQPPPEDGGQPPEEPQPPQDPQEGGEQQQPPEQPEGQGEAA